MKRVILVGAVAFLLGTAASPKAANEDESLSLLCARYKLHVEGTRQSALKRLRDSGGMDSPEAAQWAAITTSLGAMERMVCVK